MKVTVNNAEVHVATGGVDFDSTLPAVVFLAGSGGDHRTWALQTRWFAFHGFAVIAPDFPAHSLSAGEPLTTIEDAATWLEELLDELNVQQAHIVGHSQGFLTGLEFASQYPERVSSLIGVATSIAIPVNPALIDTAKANVSQAATMMLQWGFGPMAHRGSSALPGMQPIAVGRAIMQGSPLADDLQSCAAYTGGEAAAKIVRDAKIRTAMILAGQDKMTPLKSGLVAVDSLGAELQVLPEHGHMLPIEAPKEVQDILKKFIVRVE